MENKVRRNRIVWVCIVCVLIAAMLAGVLYYIFKPDPGMEVELISPEKRDGLVQAQAGPAGGVLPAGPRAKAGIFPAEGKRRAENSG